MTMQITEATFEIQTRAGLKFTLQVLKDLGHAYECKVLKGRKPFMGKTMVFAKNDFAAVQS